jgi:hypothetical protein
MHDRLGRQRGQLARRVAVVVVVEVAAHALDHRRRRVPEQARDDHRVFARCFDHDA